MAESKNLCLQKGAGLSIFSFGILLTSCAETCPSLRAA
jgi:hypothetical protein